ncbi:unnamed protein product [Rhodiola kirilowii]
MATIRPIPKAVHSSMRSGTVLFDLTRVVEELIYNSLDASATKVSVCVGIRTCYVEVMDDGHGITRNGLMLLGEKYATSKMKSLADMDALSTSFGFRGEALGSVSDISLLEIITKTHGMPNGYRKIIKGCKCLYLGVDDSRQDTGTAVTVRDLYYNQPVRRKHMQNSPSKVLHSVKKCVLRIALMHPKLSFTVIDIESEEELFSTQSSTSPLPLLIKEFGAETCENLLELNIADGMFQLSGHVSRPQDTYSPKALQFIYINLRYVGKCRIHKLLNELSSRFAYPDSSTVRKRNRAQMNPTYILNLTCPRSLYDLSFEPSHTSVEFKEWSYLLTFIERTILKFWSKKLRGDKSRSVPAYEEGDPLIPLEKGDSLIPFEEDSRTKHHALEDIGWIANAKSSIEYFTEKRRQKQVLESPNMLSFQSHMVINDIDKQQCESGFVFKKTCHAWDYENKTNWSRYGYDEYQCPEDELCYLEDKSQLYSSNLAKREKSNVQNYPSRMDGDLFHFRSNTINKSQGKVLCEDNFKFRDDISSFKPCLQSCSTRASTSFESYANDGKDDIFTKQLNHVSVLDRVDATEDESYQKSKFSASSGQNDVITDVYSCSPDRVYSRYGSQGQYVDLSDIDDGITDDLFGTNNCVPRALWQVDPASALLSPPRKRMCSVDTYYMAHSSEDRDHAFRQVHLSHGNNYDFGSDNCFTDIQTPDSIDHDTFGFSTEWSDQPSSKPEAKRKGAYRDGSMYREMEDALFDHDIRVGEIEKKCYDKGLEFEKWNYFNKDPPKYVDKHYQDDYWSAEDANWFASDENFRFNSCRMDKKKTNSCSKSSFNGIPSSSSCFEDEERKMQFRANDCSRRIRSHSAPPFFRRKKKFIALSDYISGEIKSDSKSAIRGSVTQGVALTLFLLVLIRHSHYYPYPTMPLFLQNIHHISDSHIRTLQVFKSSCNLLCGCDSLSNFFFMAWPFSGLSPGVLEVSIDSGMKWRDTCQISAIEQSRNLHHERKSHDLQDILDVSSDILHFSADLLVPKCIDKDCLMDAKVLQQVDKKFIPIVGRGIMAVIDQHAADERIRLEELRNKVLSGEVKETTYLDEEQMTELPEVGYQLLHKYAAQIQNWGWICNVHAHASDSLTKNMNLLHRSSSKAVLLAVPCILGISLSDVDLLEYLQQLADTDGSSTIPPAIIRILNSKACRGAIMFGDVLLPSECSLLVEELKNTSLCFQCAHGRPTTVPLVNLRALHKQITKLPISNDEPRDSWHGLSRRQISLSRLQKQLYPASLQQKEIP